MAKFNSFFKVLKSLQSEEQRGDLARDILECLAQVTEADRGFIVVKQDDSFKQVHQIRFTDEQVSAHRHSFSRSLVREAIRTGQMVTSRDIKQDRRFAEIESINGLPPSSVIAAPFGYAQEIYGTIYLERELENGAFSQEAMSITQRLVEIVGQAIKKSLRLEELELFRREHASDFLEKYDFQGIIGRSPAMIWLLKMAVQMAQSDAPVLIRGETGVGKELIARTLYANSPRKGKPFVTVHCGALPDTLFEAELFGHTKGAFTGANRDRAGRIAQADGGTLFIDEVGEIPFPVQAKLLRFFQFGDFQRIGSDHMQSVDVRIVVATHRDLRMMVEQGTFREDLYFRLCVLELEVPPLRERQGDVELLIQHFFEHYRPAGSSLKLGPELFAALTTYPYPGNVRELAHALQRICVLGQACDSMLDLLPPPIRAFAGQLAETERGGHEQFADFSNKTLKRARIQASEEAIAHVEKTFLIGLMHKVDGNVGQASKLAGINRTYLYRLLSKYAISSKQKSIAGSENE